MILKIGETEYTLRLPCKKFRTLKAKLGNDLMETISTAMQTADVDVMADAFVVLCTDPAVTNETVYDVLDAYLAQEENTVMSLGGVILRVFDESGFLPKKGMATALSRKMNKEMEKALLDLQEPDETAETVEAPQPFTGHTA